jgi:ABC-2 type transport system ATP-binding protein
MNQAPLLEATDLSHSYGTFQVLAPLDLTMNPGEIAILEGPNGSGKTTLLHCLSGLMHPTTGEILVEGRDIDSDSPAVKHSLAFIAVAHAAGDGFEARAEALMKDFGLWEARDLFPHHYSRGMSLKLGLLLALIRPFKILLLDEPASALDTASKQLLIHHLVELRARGATIFLSTHDSRLKHGLADRVYYLKEGQLVMD